MNPATSHSRHAQPLSSEASLPAPPVVESDRAEIVDALLAFCQRAAELKATLSPSSQGEFDFSRYTKALNDIKPREAHDTTPSAPLSAASMRPPEAIAQDLAKLTLAQLSSPLVTEDLGYWLAVTSALSASMRSTMPTFSDQLEDARSEILQLRTENLTFHRRSRE